MKKITFIMVDDWSIDIKKGGYFTVIHSAVNLSKVDLRAADSFSLSVIILYVYLLIKIFGLCADGTIVP